MALMIAVCFSGWAHSRIPQTTPADRGAEFVPSPRAVRAASLGFDALLSDYYWLQAVQVVGGSEDVDAATATHLGKLIDVVTSLNPHVGHPYRFAAVWLNQTEELVREGNRLLERGIENDPDEWRNHFYLGFNHFFYLGEFEEAASALEVAMRLPGSPSYLPRLVARLKSQHHDIDVAEVFLRELLRTMPDEEASARIRVSLDEIEIEHKARHLDRAREAYRALAGRDIENVGDLTQGEHRVLEMLPSAEPDSIPASLRRGSVWRIDSRTDRIVSSYIGARYEVHFSAHDRVQFEVWGENGEAPKRDG
ncbi:MAG: hypothetical protein CL908_13050 [Deltaproteobacteria bacterium]|nr:hypothetical protein [Deltaproteobacteria bacterium]